MYSYRVEVCDVGVWRIRQDDVLSRTGATSIRWYIRQIENHVKRYITLLKDNSLCLKPNPHFG